MTRPFHRPARLEDAESIEGSQDTAVASELAHRAAQALVGGFPETGLTREGVRAVAARGVDEVAELWADSPATTLPGTLWRLLLVREWLRRDPELISRRYATVLDLSTDAEAAARFETAEARPAPSPEQVRAALDTVLAGRTTGSVTALAPLLSATATFLR
ncbi:hypothetical protein, partial [Actinomyces sp. 217892]|uniref:hypothetical protein n=1 Tax=Actinomyces sp. 217892 TaxID=2927827 RepID=UPI0020302465